MGQTALKPQARLCFLKTLSPKLLQRGQTTSAPHFQMLLKIHKKQTIGGGGRQSSVWTMHANMHLTCTDDQNQPRSGAAVLSRPLPRPAGRWEFDGQPGCSDGLSAGSTAETLREQPGLSLAPGRVSQSRSSEPGFWKSRRWMLGVGGERPGVAGSKSETATKLSKNRLL